jgi:ferredoxin-type protein NapF
VADRREFFRSFVKPLSRTKEESPLLVRPPYGENESAFQNKCPGCESKACVASCDEKIIVIAEDGTPTLTFEKNGCTFCEDCAAACPEGVLSLAHTHNAEQLNAVFRISLDACVAHHGVICNACKEPCIDDAILFNGLFNPIIDDNRCTGCGFCMARCPTQAISYLTYEVENKTEEVNDEPK